MFCPTIIFFSFCTTCPICPIWLVRIWIPPSPVFLGTFHLTALGAFSPTLANFNSSISNWYFQRTQEDFWSTFSTRLSTLWHSAFWYSPISISPNSDICLFNSARWLYSVWGNLPETKLEMPPSRIPSGCQTHNIHLGTKILPWLLHNIWQYYSTCFVRFYIVDGKRTNLVPVIPS